MRQRRLKWAIELVPDDETSDAFCMRVADGNLNDYLTYSEMRLSEVWRIYAHQVRLFREQHRP